MHKFDNFRKEYPVFVYRSFDVSRSEGSLDVSFVFSIEGLAEFRPSWNFPLPGDFGGDDDVLRRLAFSLGLAEAVSYWKATCSPEFRVECGALDAEQAAWWKKLWFLGLGEFFYSNGIETDIDSFVNIVSAGEPLPDAPATRGLEGCLVPIGGGKDSALTLDLLTQAGVPCRCYAINKRDSISATVETAGLPASALVTAKRNFDRSLIPLNQKGFLNGHTPFSSVVAFSAEITAYLAGLEYVVLSNEASANESTVAGSDVNHQYSKSFSFEKDFHEYEEKYLRSGVYYFSFLRPLTEFQIAKAFASREKYLPVFRSCNLGSKVSPDIWCGECPKCLFVALILSPFLGVDRLVDIFGRDMLGDEKMKEYFFELVGQSEHKPFECVGSVDEANLAVSLAIRDIEARGGRLPLLFEEYKSRGLYRPETLCAEEERFLRYFNEENLLPEKFKNILLNETERLL